MNAILRKHGFERDIKNAHYKHLSVDEYKDFAAKKAAIQAANRQINELKKKPDAEFTAEDAVLLNNQNDFLRQKFTEQDKLIEELRGKLNAKFVPFEIFSEDKLQFVSEELAKIDIPFVEENTTLYVPEYAKNQAAAIAASYRPSKTEGIRDKIKLEIDRLVYCSKNLDDLFGFLRARGYEIKNGKYLAVKPTFAQRFVRLQTLGVAYFPKNLEQRIANRNNYTNAVQEKFQTAGEVEKKFHIEIMNVVIAVKQFTYTPRKSDPTKLYTFQNDAEINYLAEQLITIRDLGITSREQMYSKAADLQEFIENYQVNDDERQQLKRISELINAYEKIVEGNYIDNLIKAQKEQQATKKPPVPAKNPKRKH